MNLIFITHYNTIKMHFVIFGVLKFRAITHFAHEGIICHKKSH